MGHGLGLSQPKPSLSPNPWPGLLFYEAWAPVSQAKAPAFRPSQSRNITTTASSIHWGRSKFHYQLNPPSTKEEDLHRNVVKALDTVTLTEMQRYMFLIQYLLLN